MGRKSLLKVDIRDPNSYVLCKICGQPYVMLSNHIQSKHQISGKEYKKKYGSPLVSNVFKNNIKYKMLSFLSKPINRKKWKDVQQIFCKDLTREERKKLWGRVGQQHGMWGKRHSLETIEKNRKSNIITSAKIKKYHIENGSLLEYYRKRVNKGKKNGMYGKHPPKGSGRCGYFLYTSVISNNCYWLQGSYEVRFAKILDKLGYCWEKNKDRFKYNYKGYPRTYTPDFKVYKANSNIFAYYEIKGYIDEMALVKFAAMNKKPVRFFVVDKKKLERYERVLGNV